MYNPMPNLTELIYTGRNIKGNRPMLMPAPVPVPVLEQILPVPPRHTNSGELLDLILEKFFVHQVQIKLLHFQTNKYATHVAVDQYSTSFLSKLDQFFEVAQGLFGIRVMTNRGNKNLNITINLLDEQNTKITLEQFRDDVLYNKINQLYSPDLLAIRDEIAADLNKLLYLLTFK